MFKKFYRIFILIFLFGNMAQAQDTKSEKLDAINNYVVFSNESTHGMLIINRLLENFNTKVNNYVLNDDSDFMNYSNADLPKDIFLDLEHWFYEISPTQLYNVAINNSKSLTPSVAKSLNEVIKKMKSITTNTNKYRLDLESVVSTMNYKDPIFLQNLYKHLNEAVILFDNYYIQQLKLESLIATESASLGIQVQNEFFTSFDEVYIPMRKVLNDIRYQRDMDVDQDVEMFNTSMTGFNNVVRKEYFTNRRSKRSLNYITVKSGEVKSSMKNFIEDVPVPEDYKDYGKYYFYHNADLLNKTNKYGNGIISQVNMVIQNEKLVKVMYFEVPHFYMVVEKTLTWKKRDYSKKLNIGKK